MRNFLDRLERKCHGRCIPNLMLYIVMGMAAVYLIDLMNPALGLSGRMALNMPAVMRGEVWRLLSFVLLPPASSIIWVFISLYFYYLIGSALENHWGCFRFNVFYLTGIIGSILAAVVTGHSTNQHLNLSLFFAFALLYPEFQILLFFVLPIKIKYLAILNAALFLASFIAGPWSTRFAIIFSLLNLALFFYQDFLSMIRQWKRRQEFKRNMRR